MMLTVYFDGGCALCMREIAFYRKMRGAEKISWVDIALAPDGEVSPGLSKCNAMKRFHIRDDRGRLYSGARAFAKLWGALPRFRWLGKIAQIPPSVWLLEGLYRLFLPARPLLQGFARKAFAE